MKCLRDIHCTFVSKKIIGHLTHNGDNNPECYGKIILIILRILS